MATSRATVKRRVTASLAPKTTREDINNFMESIYKLSGCLRCGLLGFDVNIAGPVINPVIKDTLGSPNVHVRIEDAG